MTKVYILNVHVDLDCICQMFSFNLIAIRKKYIYNAIIICIITLLLNFKVCI